MDYNLHKSNSTYFSDLDVSRTALVTDIYTPGVELIRRELDQKLVDDDGDGDDTAAVAAGKNDTPPAGGKIDIPDAKNVKQEVLEEQKAKNQEFVELDPEWNWENIEKERVRGMELVKHFVGLERGLVNELGL
ncbi:hypothetical protein KEM54_004031 [Ascosphaera aggregata]|nr:hypothetical protein KEM54_004031 [Ascosphaera aggregata]